MIAPSGATRFLIDNRMEAEGVNWVSGPTVHRFRSRPTALRRPTERPYSVPAVPEPVQDIGVDRPS